jgi:hypothetical protein
MDQIREVKMGTNYYLEYDECECCGHAPPKKHIGKSSAGWCFSLHVYPPDIKDLDDWEDLFCTDTNTIVNEYDEVLTPDQMLDIIMNRDWGVEWTKERLSSPPYGYIDWKDCFRKNFAVMGPKGLMRYKIDRTHCIGHGEGTWDLCIGEFS